MKKDLLPVFVTESIDKIRKVSDTMMKSSSGAICITPDKIFSIITDKDLVIIIDQTCCPELPDKLGYCNHPIIILSDTPIFGCPYPCVDSLKNLPDAISSL